MVQGSVRVGASWRSLPGFWEMKCSHLGWHGVCRRAVIFMSPGGSLTCLCCHCLRGERSVGRACTVGTEEGQGQRGPCGFPPESASPALGCPCPFSGLKVRSAATRAQESCRSFSIVTPVLPPGLWAGLLLAQRCLPSLYPPPSLPLPQLQPQEQGSFPGGSHGQER